MSPHIIETGSMKEVERITGMDYTANISGIKMYSDGGLKSFDVSPGTLLHFADERLANQIGLQLQKASENENAWIFALKQAKGVSFSSKETIEITCLLGETKIATRSPVVALLLQMFLSCKEDGMTLLPRRGEHNVYYNGKVLDKSYTIPLDVSFGN